MSPRVLVSLAAFALLGAVSAAAWALTRPAEEQKVPPIRIESPAQLREAAGIEEPRPRERRGKAREEDRERRGGFAPATGDEDRGGGDDEADGASRPGDEVGD